MSEPSSPCETDVVILGAGWSGLLACKYVLAEGLSVAVLESRDTIGGVWAYTDNPGLGGVMKNTQSTSSRCMTEMSDFPMPANYPDFPSHGEVMAYLQAYCDRFGLNQHLRLGCAAERACKVDGLWHVTAAGGQRFRAKNLIVTSGVHQYPNDVSGDRRFHHFTGRIQHSAAIKELLPGQAGKTMVVWGGGESASDIAVEGTRAGARVYWCIPNGQWFVPKILPGFPPFPSARRKVLDHFSSRLRLFLSPTHRYSPFISQYLEHTFGFNGHGQTPWKSDSPYNRSFFNKSSEVLARLASGEVIAKRDVARTDGERVYFDDGTSVSTDLIVTCSGYRAEFPFFPEMEKTAGNPRTWYKHIFHPEDPTLAFVGFVRPIFGSIPGIAELQARYAALVAAGKRLLPSKTERDETIQVDAARWNKHFRNTSLRLHGLVDHFLYSKDLAALIGCAPPFGKLLVTNPKKWWLAISSPWNGCQFWLHDSTQHPRVFETFARYRDNQVAEVYTFLLLAPILPLIGLCTNLKVALREWMFRRSTAGAPDNVPAAGFAGSDPQTAGSKPATIPLPEESARV